jgi:hypothetical protein
MMALFSGCTRQDANELMCVSEAEKRLIGKVYRLSTGGVSDESGDAITISSEVILNPGTSQEQRQQFHCVVARAEPDAAARVISFRFDW